MKSKILGKFPGLKHNAILSAAVLLLLYLLNFIFFYPVYESNDDISFQLYASGFYTGEPESRLIFTNSVFGSLLSLLYGLSDQVNWYTLIMLLSQFLAFWSLLFQAGKNDRGVFYWLVVLFLLVFPAWYISLKINFTTTAALLSLSGFFTLFQAKKAHEYRLAWCLYFLGIMLRYESVILTHLLFVPFIPVLLGWKNALQQIRRFAVPSIIFIALFSIQRISYRDSSWQELFRLNREKALLDHPVSRNLGQLDEIALKSAGWSKNDVDLFRNFVFEDPATMQPEKMKALKSLLPERSNNPLKSWREILHGSIQWIELLNPLYYLILAIALLAIAWNYYRQVVMIFGLFLIVTAFFAWIYLPRERGMTSILLAAATLTVMLFQRHPNGLKYPGATLLLLATCGSLLLLQSFSQNADTGQKIREQAEAKLNYLKANQQYTHIIVSTAMQFEGLHPLKQYWTSENRNIRFIWAANLGGTPYQQKALNRLKAKNVFGLLLRPNTRLISSHEYEPLLFQTYIQERFKQTIAFETILQEPGFYIWSFNKK